MTRQDHATHLAVELESLAQDVTAWGDTHIRPSLEQNYQLLLRTRDVMRLLFHLHETLHDERVDLHMAGAPWQPSGCVSLRLVSDDTEAATVSVER